MKKFFKDHGSSGTGFSRPTVTTPSYSYTTYSYPSYSYSSIYDSDSYYYKSSTSSSLGWGKDRFMESVSKFSFHGRSLSEEVKIYELLSKAISDTKVLIDILDLPEKVEVVLRPENFIEGKTIFVPTDIIDDKGIAEDDVILTICGYGIHEAAHLKYTTNLSHYRKFKRDIGKEWRSECDDSRKLINTLIDLIEDVRVNNSLLLDRAGLYTFIEKLNDYKYNNLLKTISSKLPKGIQDFIIGAISLISFPDKFNYDQVEEEYKNALDSIRDILKKAPKTSLDSCFMGWNCFLIIDELLSQLGIEDKAKLFDCIRKLSNNMGVYSSLTDSNLLKSEFSSKVNSALTDSSSRLGDLLTGAASVGMSKTSIFEKIKSNDAIESTYLKDKEKVSKFVPAIKKQVSLTDKNFEYVIHGCRSGLLDTNKLVEAYQGVPHVYVRKGSVVTNRTTVCVLVDESGSMQWYEKIGIARRAAVLINEALGNLPGVDLYIYGHTADVISSGETVIRTYKDRNTSKLDRYLLGSIGKRPLRENRDGTAIREVTKKVREFTSSKCLLFILSDGQPAAVDYGGRSALKDVRDAVENAERDNFDVVQVTIDHISESACKEMGFKNSINLENDLSNFPERLAKIIKTAVLKDKTTKISN